VDLVVNRANGVENTALFAQYLTLDEQVRPLVLVIKHWAKCRGVCNARNSSLSSYGWTLLAVHFLQRTSPPVLPALQRRTVSLAGGAEASAVGDWCLPAGWAAAAAANKDTVGTLLLKFFAYYSLPHAPASSPRDATAGPLFNVFRQVIALDGQGDRLKTLQEAAPTLSPAAALSATAATPTEEKGFPAAPWWRMCIADPVDATCDVGRVIHRHEGQVFIFNELRRGLCNLLKLHHRCSSAESVTYLERNYPYEALCAFNESVPDLEMKCFVCGATDHLGSDCTEVRCPHCTSRDHTARNCPNKICFRCRGYHVQSQCPLSTAPPAAPLAASFAAAAAAGRATSVIPMAMLKPPPTPLGYDGGGVGAGSSDMGIDSDEDFSPARLVAGCDGDGFIEDVLAWRANDFLNQELFHRNLHHSPLKFESADAWYQTFYPFILEEMRAQIQMVVEGPFLTMPRCAVNFHCAIARQPEALAGMSSIPAYMILPAGLNKVKFEEVCTGTVGLLVSSAKGMNRDVTTDALRTMPHLLVRIEFGLAADSPHLRANEKELMSRHPGSMIFSVHFLNDKIAVDLLLAPASSKGPQWELFALGVGTYSSIRTCNALASKDNPPLIMTDVVTGQDVCASQAAALGQRSEVLRGARAPDVCDEFTMRLNPSQKDAVAQVLEVGSELGISTIQLIKGPPGKSLLVLMCACCNS
jgi:hypothetical protein